MVTFKLEISTKSDTSLTSVKCYRFHTSVTWAHKSVGSWRRQPLSCRSQAALNPKWKGDTDHSLLTCPQYFETEMYWDKPKIKSQMPARERHTIMKLICWICFFVHFCLYSSCLLSWLSSLTNSPDTKVPQTSMLPCNSRYVAAKLTGHRKSEGGLMCHTSKTLFCYKANNGVINIYSNY